MAEALTYNSLLSDIRGYLERGAITDTDVYAQIPRFVMYAEQRLALELKSLGGTRVVTSAMVLGESTLIKPVRWRDTISLSYTNAAGEKVYIFSRAYEYCRTFWPNDTLKDAPQYYADYDYNHWLLAPTPDASYAFELIYHERIDPLDGTNQTNWYTEYAPQILLQACMLEAMIYLKNDDRIQVWQGLYDRSLAALMGENSGRDTDRSEQRIPK